MNKTPIKITIETTPKLSLFRMFMPIALQLCVIGVGIWAESPAMQWSGFAMLCLLTIVIAAVANKSYGITIDQARKRLDEIEASQK